MSKSSGSFLHLDQLVADGFAPLSYRYFLLTAHYRSRLKFSYELLTAAQRTLMTLEGLVRAWRRETEEGNQAIVRSEIVTEMGERFMNLLGNDLHLPEALAHAWKVARSDALSASEKLTLFRVFDQVFGLELEAEKKIGLTEAQRSLLAEREDARSRRDWKRADQLRDTLLSEGIRLRDGPDGTVWELVDRQ